MESRFAVERDYGPLMVWANVRRRERLNSTVSVSRPVNVFLIGWREQGRVESRAAASALRALAGELAPLDPDAIVTWESPGGNVAVTAVGHSPEQLSISYTHFEPSRMALFAGRPIFWEPTGEANGRDTLDPRFYLAPPEQWMHSLDGRCTAVRYDDAVGSLDVYSDPLGAYPVYSANGGDGTIWLTNKPALLTELLGLRGLNARALASFFTCSWAFGGNPLGQGIARPPPASLHRFTRTGGHEVVSLLPAHTIGSYF